MQIKTFMLKYSTTEDNLSLSAQKADADTPALSKITYPISK